MRNLFLDRSLLCRRWGRMDRHSFGYEDLNRKLGAGGVGGSPEPLEFASRSKESRKFRCEKEGGGDMGATWEGMGTPQVLHPYGTWHKIPFAKYGSIHYVSWWR
jgi:hypothetical protein